MNDDWGTIRLSIKLPGAQYPYIVQSRFTDLPDDMLELYLGHMIDNAKRAIMRGLMIGMAKGDKDLFS